MADVIRVESPQIARSTDVGGTASVAGCRAALESTDPADALRAMDGFRVLAAHRRGRSASRR